MAISNIEELKDIVHSKINATQYDTLAEYW